MKSVSKIFLLFFYIVLSGVIWYYCPLLFYTRESYYNNFFKGLSCNCAQEYNQHNCVFEVLDNNVDGVGVKSFYASESHDRLKFCIKFGKKNFVYTDDFIQPPNYLEQIKFEERAINSPIFEKITKLNYYQLCGKTKEESLRLVFPKIFDTIDKVDRFAFLPAKDSVINFYPNQKKIFTVIPEVNGRKLNRDKLISDVFDSIQNKEYTCEATTLQITTDVTSEYNLHATNFRAGFATSFATSSNNRKNNIKVALSKINGTVLEPNQVFSFNETVGERTEENGFLEGKIILNGMFVDGVGGGVCQVSTTLYNAALRADMSITSVRNHSLPVGYVEPSFDAMVNSGSSDLKFENTTAHKIFIRAFAYQNYACIEFFGLKMDYKIVPQSEIVDTLPPPQEDEIIVDKEKKYIKDDSLTSGTEVRISQGKGGLVSKGYINFFTLDDRLIERRQIRTDTYKPQKGIIAVVP